ncbi:MAG: hypothetical protein N4A54_05975 [Peptostreptococcaceae bacterium]|jgi:hypothetical protein|nr:hypothetical protein [Peptostreptococcaceae bacterium]
MPRTVELNDKIQLLMNDKEEVDINWQQNFKKRKKDFFVIPFKVIDQEYAGVLFVEKDKFDEFNELIFETDKVAVSEKFQYGQSKNKVIRFLVFHDKKDNIYQHRFKATGEFKKMMIMMSEKFDIIPCIGKELKIIAESLKAYVGDPLRNF